MEVRSGSSTVVIGCYNHARFVEQCLDSAFAQTYTDLRVIVFDDASTDDSQQVIRDYLRRTGHEDVTFIAHESNRGVCASLNEVQELIDTEFVAFISADDWMLPERFERQIAALRSAGADYGLVYSDMARADELGRPLEDTYWEAYPGLGAEFEPPTGSVFIAQLGNPVTATPSNLLRTDALRSAGNYDEKLRFEDLDMYLRVIREWKITYLDDALVVRRSVDGSLDRRLADDVVALADDFRRIYRKHLGHSAEADQIVIAKISTYAKAGYLAGAVPASVAADLALVAEHVPSPANRLYALASRLRIPGRGLAVIVGAGRWTKLRLARRKNPSISS